MTVIMYAIPFFFLLIGIELCAERIKNTDYYRLSDALTSLTLGVVSRATGLAKNLVPFTLYYLALDSIAIVALGNQWWVWVLAFVLYDFCYYWLHRMSHQVNLLWAAHVVHHSSEDYNLTTALRQTSGSFLGWIFYLPMAFLGIPVEIFLTVGALNLVYQFWVHTRHVPKLGWFEWFFVSPSNHRVHHAQNPAYIDKNYGGVFILWDRYFGTFQEELDREPVIFGIRTPLKSWDPLWANLHVYAQLFSDAIHTRSWKDKCLIWFRRTGWRPADVNEAYPLAKTNLADFRKFDVTLESWLQKYGFVQHLMLIAVTLLVLISAQNLETLAVWTAIAFIFFAGFSLGAVLTRRYWLVVTESMKHVLLIISMMIIPAPDGLRIALIFISVISGCGLLWWHFRNAERAELNL